MAKKVKISDEEKQDFISKLSKMSDEDITNYIKKNGKNNSNNRLFIFHWENLNPKRNV